MLRVRAIKMGIRCQAVPGYVTSQISASDTFK